MENARAAHRGARRSVSMERTLFPNHEHIDAATAQRQCKIDAQWELAQLKRRDEIIERHQQLELRTDLNDSERRRWQQIAEIQYRTYTGVEMAQREELHARLTQAAETGDATVEEIIHSIRSAHISGHSPGTAELVFGGAGI